MQCGFGRDLIFGFPGFEDYEIHATPSFSKVTMETTYFQHEKQIFRNYNHDFRKEEIILHKTNDVLFCYTFGWGNSYFKPLFEEWPQHYTLKCCILMSFIFVWNGKFSEILNFHDFSTK